MSHIKYFDLREALAGLIDGSLFKRDAAIEFLTGYLTKPPEPKQDGPTEYQKGHCAGERLAYEKIRIVCRDNVDDLPDYEGE